ncbi:hypothetical protein ACOZB2_31430, partial [Pantoea endophytica]
MAVAVALCVTALAPLGAAAQSTTNLDAVEVTGTRIKRAEVEGQVPIQTLTRGDIERTGLTFGSGGIPQGRVMFTDPNTGACL